MLYTEFAAVPVALPWRKKEGYLVADRLLDAGLKGGVHTRVASEPVSYGFGSAFRSVLSRRA